ncbi:hypothetical protein IMSAG013_00747 [Clostridiales bacterium]|nr:hypothetical protein [Clostridiales bacterium]GFI55696.1 hypothetical protein IMSAG013_00747 [Clostridiales bacterium]
MRIEAKQCTEAGAMIRYPAFLIEETDKTCKRDRADAERMTAFYEYMKDCVLEYCHSDAFPTGGKYYADYNVHETPDGFDVEIFLRLRLRGRSIGNARLEHKWKSGVLDLEKNPCPKIRKRKKPATPVHTK